MLSPPSPPPVRYRAVQASGSEVTIEYVGPIEEGAAKPTPGRRHFLMLCGAGAGGGGGGRWLCASGWHAARREARFERLDLLGDAGAGEGEGPEPEPEP